MKFTPQTTTDYSALRTFEGAVLSFLRILMKIFSYKNFIGELIQPFQRKNLLQEEVSQSKKKISGLEPKYTDRPHFSPRKMGTKLGVWPIRRYKRFDTSIICKRSHGRTLYWHFNVGFQLLLTYNTYN